MTVNFYSAIFMPIHTSSCDIHGVAWVPEESRTRLMKIVADNRRAFLDGPARNIINHRDAFVPGKGYLSVRVENGRKVQTVIKAGKADAYSGIPIS